MTDVTEPRSRPVVPLPTSGDLDLTEERRAVLAPKLDALETEFRRLGDLERPESDLGIIAPWGHDADVRR